MLPKSHTEQFKDLVGIKLARSTELYPMIHLPGDAGLPMLVVENSFGRAVIALQGAHLMAFQPVGQREMLWVSPQCVLETGKPIRGGIPLCLPWFGPGSDGKTLHGFARIMTWSLASTEHMVNGATRLVLKLAGDATTCEIWPYAFEFCLEVVVGKELRLDFSAENCSAAVAPFSFAFHTYFAVPNVADVSVAGLDGLTFLDKTDNGTRKQQEGEVKICAETVRIYLDVPAIQTVETAEGSLKIESNAKSAVVWNAWDADKNFSDIGEGNHVEYICVERGDVASNAVTLQPSETYKVWMTLSF